MQTVNFARSFLTFRNDSLKKPSQTESHKARYTLNNARIQIDCRCCITDQHTGELQTFLLGASCKTERVGVDADIWSKPNADFVPIFSDDSFLILKTFARIGIQVDLNPPSLGKQPIRQLGNTAEAYDSVRLDVVECDGEVLDAAENVVEATLANDPLVARTEIEKERYHAVLECPIKTMNVNERDGVYQTDTGPVLLPDFSVMPDDLLGNMELAYSAFNCPDWIEFIVRVPTPIGQQIEVLHYSHPVRFEARNTVLRVGVD